MKKEMKEFNWKDDELGIDDFISLDPEDISTYQPFTQEIALPTKKDYTKKVTGVAITMKTGKEFFVPYAYQEFKKLLK